MTATRIYWLESGPHCAKARTVRQVPTRKGKTITPGKTAHVCRHQIVEGNEQP